MADAISNTRFISKANAGFPDYLDFDALRTEAIGYLGQLSGKIWTDHNVHDPGITILEMLIFALLDLGYRTNLPVADILARDPSDAGPDNNFFTQARILGCNPLTITDYRKLLVDMDGVRNAWLEVARDQKIQDYCGREGLEGKQTPEGTISEPRDKCCTNYLNGLYHVYLELEENVTEGDVPGVVEAVKTNLMQHRNLCEDVFDLTVLCRWKIGVCLDLELEEEADPQTVYFDLVGALQSFFSPAPVFYTLPDLLQKNRSIDEIFAGRPIDPRNSYGFVDTAELEALRLKKSVHRYDLFQLILGISGVRKIKQLDLKDCDTKAILTPDKGSYPIPKDSIPTLDTTCSGVRFYRMGKLLNFDTRPFDHFFANDTRFKGNSPYRYPSPNLDADIPKGIFRPGLGSYYSIQNEFPRVYGIAKGGIPDDANVLRKAQALQLKGFLLFFDQLLADYLSQLSHIRSLFALQAPTDPAQQHTYFINTLKSVPDLQKLTRFPPDDTTISPIGGKGSVLAFAMDKQQLMDLVSTGKINRLDVENQQMYIFPGKDDCETAIRQFQDDFVTGRTEAVIVTKVDSCVFFYITGSSDTVVLVSRRYSKDSTEAANTLSTVKYLATLPFTYRSLILSAAGEYGFELELNLLTYSSYLQQIAEDADQYTSRRQIFLRHLLSRFAEQFTDYALLSYGFLPPDQLAAKDPEYQQRFLANYDQISAKRGKAYDYLENGWNNYNISGFEKRFKMLCGIDNLKKHSLCNFEVVQYEAQFIYTLTLGGEAWFNSPKEFVSASAASQAVHSLFKSLPDCSRYKTARVDYDDQFMIIIEDPLSGPVRFKDRFATAADAEKVAGQLQQLFSEEITGDRLLIYSYQFNPRLKNAGNVLVRQYYKQENNAAAAMQEATADIGKINDPAVWTLPAGQQVAIERLLPAGSPAGAGWYIDLGGFKIDTDDDIEYKPGKFKYEVLEKDRHLFKFESLEEFDDALSAHTRAETLVVRLMDDSNYSILPDPGTARFSLFIMDSGQPMARTPLESAFRTMAAAEERKKEIQSVVRALSYQLVVDPVPYEYKFRYALGYGVSGQYQFESDQVFRSEADAAAAARRFNDGVNSLKLDSFTDRLSLTLGRNKKNLLSVSLRDYHPASDGEIKATTEAVGRGLAVQQEIHRLSAAPDDSAFTASVQKDPLSQLGEWVYRLVNKDGYYGFYAHTAPDQAGGEALRQEAITNGLAGHFFLELSLSGNITARRYDEKTCSDWYHFLLKAENFTYQSGPLTGQPLVLFESIQGYGSEQEAMAAFSASYLTILGLAADKANYGHGLPISPDPLYDHTGNACPTVGPLVFVPRETLNDLGDYDEKAIEALAALVLSYPIRRIAANHKNSYQPGETPTEWDKRFPCADNSKLPDPNSCPKKELYYYYFALYNSTAKLDDWQSTRYYDTPEQARADFDFFLFLLKYYGSYRVDCSCTGDYRVYVREVLAESTDRFPTRLEAWGREGVEKFICVAQAENAFHTILDAGRCCYTFYVGCYNNCIQLPCRFDFDFQRDEAIQMLYSTFKQLEARKNFSVSYTDNNYLLKVADGSGLARLFPEQLPIEGRTAGELPPDWPRLIINVFTDRYYRDHGAREGALDNQGQFTVVDDKEYVWVESVATDLSFEDWRSALRGAFSYYSGKIIRRETPEKITYSIALKQDEPVMSTTTGPALPYPCPEPSDTPPDDFCNWWQQPVVFDSEHRAMTYLIGLLPVLSDHRNYQALFSCPCGANGIALHTLTANARHMGPWLVQDQPLVPAPQDNRIIAINPNCYPHPDAVCAAVERARQLINSEGLHLVEHILLRPRCLPGDLTHGAQQDCGCKVKIAHCASSLSTDCELPWWREADNQDPCDERLPVCFIPGYDPYSFIATVVLPAWPARFRTNDNRQRLETILYREAPAHIMLRILWLAPMDLCQFEDYFKAWGHWLRQDGHCYSASAPCDLIDFLFHSPLRCLEDCQVCLPCDDKPTDGNTCPPLDLAEDPSCAHRSFPDFIKTLYCWPLPDCKDSVIAAQVPVIDMAGKRKFINGRLSRYRKDLDELLTETRNNKMVAMGRRFLDNPQPSATEYNHLVTEIVHAGRKAGTGSKKTGIKWMGPLLQHITWYFLDKWCFNGKEEKELEQAGESFRVLSKNGVDPVKLLSEWNPERVKKYEPGLDLHKIEQYFLK